MYWLTTSSEICSLRITATSTQQPLTMMSTARVMAMRAASAPRELAILTKRTIQEMANIATHQQAIAKELEPQVWTTRQPWFAERLAALQSRIKKS